MTDTSCRLLLRRYKLRAPSKVMSMVVRQRLKGVSMTPDVTVLTRPIRRHTCPAALHAPCTIAEGR